MAADLQPFVGPVAFRGDQGGIFFGRLREERELLSMVIAHPMVLLYAPSGAGKSSLVNAKLIPILRKRSIEVLGPARVKGQLSSGMETPQNIYTCNLISSFGECGGQGGPAQELTAFLGTLPHAVDEAGEKTLRVLVIDQLEELFTFAPECWPQREAFILQLAAALDHDPLVRVLLAIKEDYLAQLDAFAALLPGQLRHRFRLDLLLPDAAQLAIEEPVKLAGREIDEGALHYLRDELLKVRVQGAGGGTSEVVGEHVEPVQLQVVCDAVWASLPDGVKTITTGHVKAVGDVDGALGRFYENVLEETARETLLEKDELRAWVDEYLITPEGTRGLAYQGKALTGRGGRGIPNTAVAKLEGKHLLRAETRPGGERWYELCHDRFIAPIQASNQVWKQRRQRRRFVFRVGAVSLAVVIVILGVAGYFGYREVKYREEYERADGQIDRLLALSRQDPDLARRKAESVLPNVAGYLWQKPDLARLEAQLKRAENLIGEDFGNDPWVSLVMPLQVEAPPLTVQYSSSSGLDPGKLQYQWAILAREVARIWGIPAPQYAQFEEVDDLPPDQVRVRTHGGVTKTIGVTALPRGWWITSNPEGGDPRLPRWFEARQDQWVRIGELKRGGGRWGVPAWTVPLLRAAGAAPSAREGAVILAVLNGALAEPELLLTEENTALLLRRSRYDRRVAVDEALAARGGVGQLTRDLRAVVRDDMSLVHLAYVLDALAHAPAGADALKAARVALESYASQSAPARKRLAGPAPSNVPKLDVKAPLGSYAATLRWAPLPSAPVRVRVGTGLQDRLVDGNGKPLDEVLERAEKARGDLYRRLGVAPEPIVWNVDKNIHQAFAIEILNQSTTHDDARPIEMEDAGTAANRLFEELDSRFSAVSGWWLTAEDVEARLHRLAPKTRDWLLRQYSVTDVIAILRRLLDEHGGSLRESGWLLESLVFWAKAVEDPSDSGELARALAQTQQARRGPPPATSDARSVQQGIAALERGDPDAAAGHFKVAVDAGRGRAALAFLAAYARRDAISAGARLGLLRAKCGVNQPGKVATRRVVPDTTRFEIEEYLAQEARALRPQDRTSLELCLVRAYVRFDLRRSAESALERIAARNPAELTPDQLYATGFQLLDLAGFPAEQSALAEPTIGLLLAAFRRWEDARPAEAALSELINRYRDRYSVPSWYLAMLGRLVEQRQDSFLLAFEMGFQLANSGRTVEDGAKALEWLSRAERRIQRVEKVAERARLAAWMRKYRADAHQLRALHGDSARRPVELRMARSELEALIAKLRDDGLETNTRWPGLEAYVALIDLHRMARDDESASTVLGEALAAFPDDPNLANEWVAMQLNKGNIAEAVKRTRQWLGRPGISRNVKLDFQLKLALMELLSGSAGAEEAARAFLNVNHPYRDYVRMLLYWRLSLDGNPRGAAYLEERWKQIRPDSWKARLEAGGGDEQVWRERLIGYYHGEVGEDDLMAPLRDRQTFEKSPYSRMGVHGLSFEGMTCEANFYSGLLHHVSGDRATRERRLRERLRKCVEVAMPTLYEYQMAQYLLSKSGGQP